MNITEAVAAVERHLASSEFSGTVLITSGEDALLQHASGMANRSDGIPNQIDTRFGIASVTKTFTAAAVCRLVDQGKATFDDRVTEILPADKRPATLDQAITLHHLLTHTSGIADYFDEVNLGAGAFADIWLHHPSYLFTDPIDFLTLFSDLPPLKPPGGTEASYCSAGFVLLGLVIEELSSRPYRTYIEEEIFARSGMASSGFLRMDEIHPNVAIGYVEDEAGGWKTNHYSIPVVGGADGGAYSTVWDLARFLGSLGDGTLLSADTWRVMSTPHVTMEDVAYGYGLIVADIGGITAVGHGGADPGFSARAFRYPDLDVNVTMLGNTIDETDPVAAAFRGVLESN